MILKGKIIDLTFVFRIFVFMFVIVFGFVFVFMILGLVGHEGMGPVGPAKARRGGFGVKKKTCLINGSGPGFWGRPASRVWVWKNQARTQPIAIPRSYVFKSGHML